ncbi:MAG TPA: PQQ-binding-like beta-propeller repeat protein [Bacteroidales bacterium]|nr:PQQ-binding-like beta-propeller repeat protein [Bacteroidales bacterium]
MSPFRYTYGLITGIAITIFAGILLWWLLAPAPFSLDTRIPGMDNRPPLAIRSDSVVIGEFFDTMGIIDETAYGDWPRFRGTDLDNVSKDTVPLAESWDTSGPGVVWKTTLGEGYAGASVHNGKVYLLDYNERRKADALRCFSLATGKELWRRWYNVDLKRNHGYSRTIPTVTDKYVLTIGPRSHVMCTDPESGNLLWSIDLEKEFGIPGWRNGQVTPDFFTGQCPLIDNGIAVIAPGIKALMIGVDCASGQIVWQTPNPDSLKMSHGSIMPMTLHGKRMYVYNAVGGVCGISAEPGDAGKLLWLTKEWSPATTAASPLYLGDNEIAVFGSYGAGAGRIRVNFDGSEFSAEVLEMHKANEGISSDQQTPVLNENFVWVVPPANAGELKRQLVCYDKSDLIKPAWSSGKENRYGSQGLGPYILSGDKLFLLDDEGTLYLFRLQKNSASLLSSHKIFEKGKEAWGPMALAGKYLLLRDAHNLVCLDISKK